MIFKKICKVVVVDFKVRLTFFINEKLCHVGLYRVVHKSHTVFSFIT